MRRAMRPRIQNKILVNNASFNRLLDQTLTV